MEKVVAERNGEEGTVPEIEILESQMPIIGARIERARRRQGYSVREMAERAGVDKNAILRLERGKGTSTATLLKVGKVLGESARVLTMPEVPDPHAAAVHLRMDDKWWPESRYNENFMRAPESASADEATRKKIALEDGEAFFEMMFVSRLGQGRLRPSFQELYKRTRTVTHRGEEFVLCLKGTAIITVSGHPYRLEEGESITFWSSEQHSYAPAEELVASGELPVRILTVRLDDDLEARAPTSPEE